ncbi:MAG: DedA family protein [Deltaproteobacteria bacterium]|nr:DedA family protein [Deltaproteobacteria bacterium]
MEAFWEFLASAVGFFWHLDLYLNEGVAFFGPWIYLLLFLIVFCETGLVVTPFLPGDSLLFAVGALAALDHSPLNLFLLAVVLVSAAILGDTVNYTVGSRIGTRVFQRERAIRPSRWLNRKHLMATQLFYEKHGGKTIILARFLPIIRTFAPFVAGVGKMEYRRFATFNVTGGLFWVLSFLLGGYYFGNIPVIQRNFEFVVVGIIFVSCLPLVIRLLKSSLG